MRQVLRAEICDFGAVFVLTNTAVKTTDDLQYIYPTRETISRGDVSIMQSWPVWNGVDRSWYNNVAPRMTIFGHDVHRNFFGVYYHHSDYGVVHVATYRQDPGKKIWSWGTARSGKIWDNILTDNDGSIHYGGWPPPPIFSWAKLRSSSETIRIRHTAEARP